MNLLLMAFFYYYYPLCVQHHTQHIYDIISNTYAITILLSSQLPWGTSLSLPDVKAQLASAAQFFQLLSLSSQGVNPEK